MFISKCLEYERGKVFIPHLNMTIPGYRLNALAYNPTYTKIMYWTQAVLALLPVALVYVFNTLVIIGLRRNAHARSKMSTSGSGNNRGNLTTLLVAVATVFLVCVTPSVVSFVVNASSTNGDATERFFTKYIHVANVFKFSNATWNFWLYCVCSSKFRGAFISLFCHRDGDQDQSRLRSFTKTSSLSQN